MVEVIVCPSRRPYDFISFHLKTPKIIENSSGRLVIRDGNDTIATFNQGAWIYWRVGKE